MCGEFILKKVRGNRKEAKISKIQFEDKYIAIQELHKTENLSISLLCEIARIVDQGGKDVPYVWSYVRKLLQYFGTEKRLPVFNDNLQLIVDPRLNGNRQAEISEISRALKQMAKELNVLVVTLPQLSRVVKADRISARCYQDYLCDSGQIE